MTESDFWDIVAASRAKSGGDRERQPQQLHKSLVQLVPEEVAAFLQRLHEQLDAAYLWELWGAAYLLMGGCGDDSFEYFRLWLIAQGRETFEKVLADPEELARIAPSDAEDECEFESFAYAAYDAYKELTGTEFRPATWESPARPRGQQWDFDDMEEMRRRYPRIWKKAQHLYKC